MSRARERGRGAAALVALGLAACHGEYQPIEPGLRVIGGPLSVAEQGGAATFQVALATAPAAAVDVDALAEDASEGLLVGPAGGAPGAWVRLRFTASDWSEPQTVTVAGVDDALRDGDLGWRVGLSVSGSDDPAYAGARGAAVQVVTRDDDTPGIRLSRTELHTQETGAPGDAFDVSLASLPAAAVTVRIQSTNSMEGRVSGGQQIAPADHVDLVFTPSSWSTPQTVVVTGVPDEVADGDQRYVIDVGPAWGDPEYAALPAQQVTVVNADTLPHVVVWPASLSFREGEGQSFFVRLATRPSEPVWIPVECGAPTEGYLTNALGDDGNGFSLVFDTWSWSQPQTLTVRSALDGTVDGPRRFQILVGPPAGDATYAALPQRSLEVQVADVDVPAISVASGDLLGLVEGGSAAMWIALASAPLADVTVPIASSDPAEALVSTGGSPPAAAVTLTFTPADWQVARVVTVSAVDDADFERAPAHPFTVAVGPGRSASPPYDGVAAVTLPGRVADDDVAPDEGAPDAPLDVSALLAWPGVVGLGSSWYRIGGFVEGGIVSVTAASDRVSLSILADDPARATLCASGPAPAVACPVRLPPGGSVLARVDGGATARGASFTLDAAPFTMSQDPPLPIADATFWAVNSSVVLSGVPASYAAIAVFVDVDHPRAADVGVMVEPAPAFQGAYSLTGCPYVTGADYDATVFFEGPSFPRVCYDSPPFAGIVRPQSDPRVPADVVNGTWTLHVSDNAVGETGTLLRWGIAAR